MTYSSTVVNNFNFLKLDVLRVAPQHREYEVVSQWDRLVDWVKEHVQEILLSEWSWGCDLESF